MEHRSLGSILLDTTPLTEDQLNEALLVHKERGIRLGDALVQLKYLRNEDILKALSIQLGFPYESAIDIESIANDLITALPINYAKNNELLPMRKEEGQLVVAIADPTNSAALDDLRLLYGCPVKPVIAASYDIVNAVNGIYNRSSDKGDSAMEELDEMDEIEQDFDEPVDLLDADDEAPIIRLVNSLLFRAVKQKTSDVHVEPFEKELSVRFRIDGVLYDIMTPPKRAQSAILSRIKIMAGLNIAEKRLPQDGRIKIKIAGRDIDIRVSTIPTAFGESAVMRLLDKGTVKLDLATLGISPYILKPLMHLIHQHHGIMLVTGPTGSGKTTTLYACLAELNSSELKILTAEDPIEYQLKGVNQVQVNAKIDLTFSSALRAFLRQDPDVILVGEIRDKETAEIAIQASLTGHMVFSTLHTNDAVATVTRMVDMGVEPFLVSSSVIGILAQRLLRTVCHDCAKKYQPTEEEAGRIGLKLEDLKGKPLFRPVGCPNCMETGYAGRTGIHELLELSDEFRNACMRGDDAASLKQLAMKEGMSTLRMDAVNKVVLGITTVEEVLRVVQDTD
jgi:general secretion pathway protein E